LRRRGEARHTPLPELAESDLIAFEADYDQGRGEWVWRNYWCLPACSKLDAALRAALGEIGLLAFSGEQPPDSADDEIASGEASQRAATHSRVRHLTVADAPVILAPLGRAALSILPVPILVPSDFEALRRQAEELIHEAVAHIRWDPEDGVAQARWEAAPVREIHASGTWLCLTEDGRAASLHSSASGCAEALARRANNVLPPFVHERYSVELAIRPIAEWSPGHKLALFLRETGQEASFPIAEGASGLHLWLQLALLEAMQSLRQLLPLMKLKLDQWTVAEGAHQDIGYVVEHDDDTDELHPTPQAVEEADALQAALRAEWQPFADAISDGFLPEGVAPDLESMAASMKPVVVDHGEPRLLALTAKRLYIIDEPERHLHPRLELHLGPWLANLVRNGTSQAIIATHSVPFLNAGSGSFVHVRRQRGERSVVATVDGVELSALSAIALELGLDRGQLLASVAVLLFVEGRADNAVLESLVGEELRQCGVWVVPLHGESRAQPARCGCAPGTCVTPPTSTSTARSSLPPRRPAPACAGTGGSTRRRASAPAQPDRADRDPRSAHTSQAAPPPRLPRSAPAGA
jgi:AAA domain, putative AbiEii toxin, Type IV TA system